MIQIKPQLERLLNLPDDSLTKEIELTQQLISLFIKYQIPSDLLSYDGEEDLSVPEKLKVVEDYVEKMNQMVARSKEKELGVALDRQSYRKADPSFIPTTVITTTTSSSSSSSSSSSRFGFFSKHVSSVGGAAGGGGGGPAGGDAPSPPSRQTTPDSVADPLRFSQFDDVIFSPLLFKILFLFRLLVLSLPSFLLGKN